MDGIGDGLGDGFPILSRFPTYYISISYLCVAILFTVKQIDDSKNEATVASTCLNSIWIFCKYDVLL